jgi:hypothetical protein
MVTGDPRLAAHERVARLRDHLGVARAHVAGRLASVVGDLLAARREAVASAALLCPMLLHPRGDRLRGLQGEGPREHGQAGEQAPLRRRQQAVAPDQGGAERPLSRWRVARAAGEL